MPDSTCAWVTQQRLWQRNLHSASFFIATSIFDRTLSPNFRLTIENVDSTSDRLW